MKRVLFIFTTILGFTALAMENKELTLIETKIPMHMAIDGAGYFVVSKETTFENPEDLFYTRDGSFTQNKAGYITNKWGYFLQAVLANSEEEEEDEDFIDLSAIGPEYKLCLPRATSLVTIQMNLPPRSSQESLSLTIYDSLGISHLLKLNWQKIAEDPQYSVTWLMKALVSDGTIKKPYAKGVPIDFNSHGILSCINNNCSSAPQLEIQWNSSAAISIIKMDLGKPGSKTGLIGVGEYSSITNNQQNGNGLGHLREYKVNSEGILIGHYDNGVEKYIAQIPIALFDHELISLTKTKGILSQAPKGIMPQFAYSCLENGIYLHNGATELLRICEK